MWEFKSKVIVMLCSLTEEEGQEACHPFWPYDEGSSAKYGKLTVTLQSETSYDSFIQRKMLIQDEKVCHFPPHSSSRRHTHHHTGSAGGSGRGCGDHTVPVARLARAREASLHWVCC